MLRLSLLVFIYTQYRNFYTVNDVTFTVWKRYGGYCYIMPYRYLGVTKPKSDYIIASNIGAICVYIDKDSTLIIYDDAYRERGIKCNTASSKWNYVEEPSIYDSIAILKRDSLDNNLPSFKIELDYKHTKIKN